MSNDNKFKNFELPVFPVLDGIFKEQMQKHQSMPPSLAVVLQKHIEMMQPIIEIAREYTEMMRPIIEATEAFKAQFGDITAKALKAMRPFLAINKFKDVQYVYWDFISIDFMEEVIASDNVNKTLQTYESQNKFQKSESVIIECLHHPYILSQAHVFEQTIRAYHNDQYDLATIGLLSVIDSVLSEASRNLTHNPLKRCKSIFDKIENKNPLDSDEYAIVSLGLTYQGTVESLYKTVSFSEKEPKNLNRHWIMHGRSKREKTQLDCIKLINFLYGIILIDELSKKEAGTS